MNILVTGASGFIGKNLVDFLRQKGHFVKALSSSDVNLASSDSVDSFISLNNMPFEVIVHGAFILCDSSQDMLLQLQDFEKNIEITKNIIKIAQTIKSKKLINLSSMAVYPNVDGNFSETSEIRPSTNPEGLYGLAKFCSENFFDLYLKNDNIIISHLRVGQIYGEGMRKDRIISVFKNELVESNTVTVFGGGERISSFMNINKLIEVMYVFILNKYPGIYNVSDEDISYYALAERIIEQHGNMQSKIIQKSHGSKAKFYLDCKKLNSII